MSMWLTLVKVEPAVLGELAGSPGPVGELFVDTGDSGSVLSGFHPGVDRYGCDYRVLSTAAEGRLEAEGGAGRWTREYPWLARAVGYGCDIVEGVEFAGEPSYFLPPEQVGPVAEGLRDERWATGAGASRPWNGTTGDNAFEDLIVFLTAAATEGKAVISTVT
ncbi:hypothetical protein OG948_52020 (plasmid) [Embleya sp. NBC_00888]|uniref:hypothetical protein n=1 Tax=Embleya sp. NBC_00888 TaxID=2975960 RepID=UPI002F914F37|nr:hypothetical protein OG948_52020 [Embleya sp. NBC_00888]